MKKVLPILFFLIFMIPVSNVFAAQVNLLEGKTLIKLHDHVSNIELATDGDIITSAGFGYNGGGAPTLKAKYVFENPTDISSIFFKGSNFALTFLDNEDKLIKTVSMTPIYEQNISILGVKTVQIHAYGSNSNPLNEIKLFSEQVSTLPVESFTEKHTYNNATLTWVNPNVQEFDGVIIKKDGIEIAQLPKTTNSYTVGGLLPETTYNFDVIAKYTNGGTSNSKSLSITTNVQPVDITAPSDISNLSVVNTFNTANFVYTLPIDTDFSHLEIYRDGTLIQSNFKESIFSDVALIPNTTYLYKFVSVDIDGNKSPGYIKTVLTDIESDSIAPSIPTGLNVVNANSAGRVSWERNRDNDISGYNLYVDGVKYNSSLILATNFVINGLSNGTTYLITVTAVDTSGNESVTSESVSLIPSQDSMPIFKANYDLKAVADGTSSWFTSFWPILAFAVGIPLAFYIAGRVKTLFFA